MTAKVNDKRGRWRSEHVGLRLSPEEASTLNKMVKLSGLSKQDYIIDSLLKRRIVVQGNPKLYIALKREMTEILMELRRLTDHEEVRPELIDLTEMIAEIMEGMKEESDWNPVSQ